MGLKEGDFVLAEYSLYVRDSGELVETTNEEEARKAGIYSPNERYGPKLVIIGEKRLIEGLEEAIKELGEGEEKEVEIPPEKAFGQRDPNKLKRVSLGLLRRKGLRGSLTPGEILEIDGKYAVVRAITGGRVVLDYNHPLAGKTLKAKVKIVKKIEDDKEKIKHLILRRTNRLSDSDIEVEEEDGKIVVKLAEKALRIADLQVVKAIVVREIEKYIPGKYSAIKFVEEVPLKREEEKTTKKENNSGQDH